jgi:hypothetical protein
LFSPGKSLAKGALIMSWLGLFFAPLSLVGWICGLAAIEISKGYHGKLAAKVGCQVVVFYLILIYFILLASLGGE